MCLLRLYQRRVRLLKRAPQPTPPLGSPKSSPAASSTRRPWRAQVSAQCWEERQRRTGESYEEKEIAPALAQSVHVAQCKAPPRCRRERRSGANLSSSVLLRRARAQCRRGRRCSAGQNTGIAPEEHWRWVGRVPAKGGGQSRHRAVDSAVAEQRSLLRYAGVPIRASPALSLTLCRGSLYALPRHIKRNWNIRMSIIQMLQI